MVDCNPESNGEWRFARHIVPHSKVVFDVGARTDDYLARIDPAVSVHLFEPLPAHCGVLRARVGALPNVVLNEFALGDVAGPVGIHPDSESIAARAGGLVAPVQVEVRRMDEYCAGAGVERIDFLKIDTEGHELHVLRGGDAMVHEATGVIQYEYGGTYRDAGIKLADVFRFLGRGWQHYRIEPEGLRRIRRYRRAYEDFQYANYVASREPLDRDGAPRRRR